MLTRFIFIVCLQLYSSIWAQASTDQVTFCEQSLIKVPGLNTQKDTIGICASAQVDPDCTSEKGNPIYHFESVGQNKTAKKILVIALVHGDEPETASTAFMWAKRLQNLKNSRNTWRIIPVLNPDGWKNAIRMNTNGVDINRNFPTNDWDYAAQGFWDKNEKKNPRRFPGLSAASEKETKCAIGHLDRFKPDMVVAIHTPYGLLDFDGPQLNFPQFKGLPWKQLGHLPGSLGRYMWYDRKIPVLTIELLNGEILKSTSKVFELQDLIGLVTLKTVHFLQQSSFDDYKK